MSPSTHNLPKLRAEQGLSQEALGKLLGISQGTVKGWEVRKSIPSKWLLPLQKVFGIDLETLLGSSRANAPEDLDRRTLEGMIYEEACHLTEDAKQATLAMIRAMAKK